MGINPWKLEECPVTASLWKQHLKEVLFLRMTSWCQQILELHAVSFQKVQSSKKGLSGNRWKAISKDFDAIWVGKSLQ